MSRKKEADKEPGAAGDEADVHIPVSTGTYEERQVFAKEKHKQYILSLDSEEMKTTLEYAYIEHLRISGIYWSVAAMHLMGTEEDMDTDYIVDWVMKCYQPDVGGFGGNLLHDPHLLYTLSAVQILALCDQLDKIDADRVSDYVASLQQEDGSFVGDHWGEVDTRFSYCALNCCALLGKLDKLDVKKATDFVARCMNFDGGFGVVPGGESHAGQIFCCVAALSIGKAVHRIDADLLGWWLCERQCDSGGLNGRPEKQSDVCYSWWVLSSLCMLQRSHWIDKQALIKFILECQDIRDGGISDRPQNIVDVFHTFFGICGLCMLNHFDDTGKPYRQVDPVYALPKDLVRKLNLPVEEIPPPC
eukprot:gb/GECG01001421.1/.p1 GENE.gb/GECG01001421.1/~~gb/GECG01001421.1/.p1  ORF type:complete len:360 (+),score=52.47 gb/GECG01001421.1/:1-1080(+)